MSTLTSTTFDDITFHYRTFVPQELVDMYQASFAWKFFIERKGYGMLYTAQELKAAGITVDMAELGQHWVPLEGAFLAAPHLRIRFQYTSCAQKHTYILHFPEPPSDTATGIRHIHLGQSRDWEGPGYDSRDWDGPVSG